MPITLTDVQNMLKEQKLFGTPVYAVANRGIFGFRVYTGIITGIRFTNSKPEFYVESNKESGWYTDVTTDKSEILEMIEIPDLFKVQAAGAPAVNMLK